MGVLLTDVCLSVEIKFDDDANNNDDSNNNDNMLGGKLRSARILIEKFLTNLPPPPPRPPYCAWFNPGEGSLWGKRKRMSKRYSDSCVHDREG